jgi:hypothetical protein
MMETGNSQSRCRVLLKWDSVSRQVNLGPSLTPARVVDYSIIPFMIEELVSFGASEFALDLPQEDFEYLTQQFSVAFRKRLFAAPKEKVIGQLNAIMGPVFEEYDIKPFAGVGLGFCSGQMNDLSHAAVSSLYFGLCDFLLGLEHELHVDVDVESLRLVSNTVRIRSRNPRTRAHMAILEGILSSYQPTKLEAVELRSCASDQVVSLFSQFVEDETYQLLSKEAHAFGIPARLKRARGAFTRLSRQMLTKPAFKSILNLGSRMITAATHVPAPDTDLASSLFSKPFLPPIVSLSNARERALASYRNSNPEFLPPRRFRSVKPID